jgi:MFS family permease
MFLENQKAFRRYENFLVIAMFFLFGIVFMDRLAIMNLFPFIVPELGLNNTQVGMITAGMGIAWAISSIIFAPLSDYFGGKKKMLIAFIFLFSIFTFASGIIGGFLSLLIVRVLMATFEGPVVPLVNSAVMAASTPKRRGFNMGFVQSASALFGSALVPGIVVAIALSMNWRSAFFILAIPGIIMAFLLMKFMKEPQMKDENQAKLTRKDFASIFKERNILLNIVISIFFMVFFTTMTAFVPLFLTAEAGYTEAQMAAYMTFFGFGIFLWNFLAPWISDRIGRKPAMVIFTLINITVPLSVIFLHDQYALLLPLTLLLTAGMGYQPLALAIIPAESVPRPLVATAIAVIVCVGEGIGGTLGPVLSGILADKFNLFSPLWVVAASCFMAFLASWGIQETAPVKITKSVNNSNVQF